MDITDVHVPWSVVIAKWEQLATKRQTSVKQVVKNIGVNQNVKVTFLNLIKWQYIIMKSFETDIHVYLCVFTITSIIASHAFNSSTFIFYLADVVQENHVNLWNCYVLLITSLMFFLLCFLTFTECRMFNALFKSFKLLWWHFNTVS